MKRALPEYMLHANIREMHQPSAVGKAIDLKLRMDWPGTGSVIAAPLIEAPGKYTVRFILVFEVSGKQQYVISTAKVVEFLAK